MNNIESTVISSRVRLARNLKNYPFPSAFQSADQGKEVIRVIDKAAEPLHSFRLYRMDTILEKVAQSLCDDHLISADLAANRKCGAALIDEEDGDPDGLCGKLSIMINEEDHLREQYIIDGLNLPVAYRRVSALDDGLSKKLHFAYDEQLGYLTACPTNLGTGLRASVMLFLPGLTRCNVMGRLTREISRLGHTVRGVYGEGSAAEGYMYQISNEVTLGVSEEYILSEVQRAVLEVVNLETQSRKTLFDEGGADIKDECCRAYGVLANCEKISYREFLKYASAVKLGIALGFLKINKFSEMDLLISSVRPSNISLLADTSLTETEQELYRAKKCRAVLSTVQRR